MLFCFAAGVKANAPTPYTNDCRVKEDEADRKFLLYLLQKGLSNNDYQIVYKLVRRHAFGFFANGDMDVYVRSNTLSVYFKNSENYLVNRRSGGCSIPR